ncbi:cell division protein FtsQ/DivIB [Amedibacillus sp. YH-ame6]
MEEIEDILYDDVEAKYLALQNKKKNRKKKRRKIKVFTVLILFVFGFLYFSSDLSKVKSLDVSGNVFYTKETVLKKAQLSYNTRYIVIPKFYIEWKLEQDELIEDVRVKKNLNGVISIQVKEKTIVGYYIEDSKNYILMNDGSKKEIEQEYLSSIVNFPLIDGFDNAQRKKLAKAFGAKNEVKPEILRMISEIVPYATSYDAHMAKIVMQDGNVIYTSYESIPLLNSYLETIVKLNKDHACLWPDINTGSIQSSDCTIKE